MDSLKRPDSAVFREWWDRAWSAKWRQQTELVDTKGGVRRASNDGKSFRQ